VAHSGTLLHLDLTLVGIVLVPALVGATVGGSYAVVWALLAAGSFVTILIVPGRGLRGALAGLALGVVGIVALLNFATLNLPYDPVLQEVVYWVRTIVLTLTGGVSMLGGWAVGRAVTETPEVPRTGAVTEQSRRWATWVRDTVAYGLRRVRPTLGKIAAWGIGLMLVIAVLAAVTAEQALVGVAIGASVVGVAPMLLSHVFDLLMGIATSLSVLPQVGVAFLLSISAVFRRHVRVLARTVLVLARFPKALCDTCLRMDAPLASSYAEGERTCSKCGATISFEGGRGRLVVVFDEGSTCGRPRVFVRRALDLVGSDTAVDVTHVRLVEGFAESEVERLVAFLRQRPPSHALKQIEVYVDSGRDGVRPYLRNILSDHFSWGTADPFGE
jgi:hypothetical protein